MPVLRNREMDICWNLDLVLSKSVDIEPERSDYVNWIPFLFTLGVGENTYEFIEAGTCFTVWEIKKILDGFDNIVYVMKKNRYADLFKERFEPFVHTCYEVFFDIKVIDADDDLIEIELWLNSGYLEGNYGYNKGFRFVVCVDDFSKFTETLRKQFDYIMSNYDRKSVVVQKV